MHINQLPKDNILLDFCSKNNLTISVFRSGAHKYTDTLGSKINGTYGEITFGDLYDCQIATKKERDFRRIMLEPILEIVNKTKIEIVFKNGFKISTPEHYL